MAKSQKALKEERILREAEQRKIYAEAKDPSTNPERLKEIYTNARQKEWFEEALAENPNTPLSVLLAVALRHPAKVLQNPALSLLHLENPNFLGQTNPQAIMSLLKAPEAPQWLVAFGASHSDSQVRYAAVKHPNLPTNLLEELIQQDLETKPPTQPIVRDEWSKAPAKDSPLPYYIAQNPNLPIDVLQRFAADKRDSVRQGVAYNPSATPELLASIFRSVEDNLNKAFVLQTHFVIAQNPNTPAEILTLLSKSKDPKIRQGVASNKKAPLPLLTTLFSDKEPEVQKALSQNPSITLDLIEKIALKKPPQHWMWLGVFSILAISVVVFYFLALSLRPGDMYP